jgi:hypothetical protein
LWARHFTESQNKSKIQKIRGNMYGLINKGKKERGGWFIGTNGQQHIKLDIFGTMGEQVGEVVG